MKVERDNFGRLVIRDAGREYYISPRGEVYYIDYTESTDKAGRIWRTPHRHKMPHGPKCARIRSLLWLKELDLIGGANDKNH
jgi:hypothetical protein